MNLLVGTSGCLSPGAEAPGLRPSMNGALPTLFGALPQLLGALPTLFGARPQIFGAPGLQPRGIGFALMLCLAASSSLHAQRDGAAVLAPTPVDATIAGRIVAAASSAPVPVARAIVTLSGAGIEHAAIADDDGRFVFADLPAGRYVIGARKVAWIDTAYGATRAGGAGTPVALAGGERRELTMTMARGAAIKGRLTMSTGVPATRTSVRAVPADGRPSPRGVDPAITDDRGVYRIYGLPPGEYVVQASPPGIPAMMQALLRPSAQEVDNTFAQLNSRHAAARAGTIRSAASPVPTPARQTVYAPVFYPGTSIRDQAAVVAVSAGDERAGVDFTFSATEMSRVAGRVAGSATSSAGAQIRLQARTGVAVQSTAAATDGTFAFAAVAPGTYEVIARLDPHRRVPGPNEPAIARVGPVTAADGSSADTLWARSDVVASGQDVEGLGLTLLPGSAMSGRVQFATDRGAPVPAGVSVRLTPVGVRQMPVVTSSSFTTFRQTDVAPDGHFDAVGVAPGTYQLSLLLPPALTADGWWARSAVADGIDLLDVTTDMTPGVDVRDVDVRLSQQHAALTGRLQLPDGRPGSAYFIIAFSADPRARRVDARRTHATRPADDGVFVLDDVPPGDYLLAVLWDFEPAMLQAPGFFEQAAAVAVPFSLAEGERRDQRFEIGR